VLSAAVVVLEIGDEHAASAAAQRLDPLLPELDDPYVEAVARLVTSWSSAIAGDFDRGVREASASLELFRQLGEPLWIPGGAHHPGSAVGDYEDAALHLAEVRERAERVPNPWLTMSAWVQLGILELARERFDDAWASLTEALDLSLAEQQAPASPCASVPSPSWRSPRARSGERPSSRERPTDSDAGPGFACGARHVWRPSG
jgi:hypothetical protein